MNGEVVILASVVMGYISFRLASSQALHFQIAYGKGTPNVFRVVLPVGNDPFANRIIEIEESGPRFLDKLATLLGRTRRRDR
jgi:hypothetical protein